MSIGPGSWSYPFCPGKATWGQDTADLFDACRVALETGILPVGSNLEDQDAHFTAALPVFIDRWRERAYQRTWTDASEYLSMLLASLFKK